MEENRTEIIEEVHEVTEEKESNKLKEFASKGMAVIKKHGTKIAAGAAIGAVALVSYSLGARSRGEDCDSEETNESVDEGTEILVFEEVE